MTKGAGSWKETVLGIVLSARRIQTRMARVEDGMHNIVYPVKLQSKSSASSCVMEVVGRCSTGVLGGSCRVIYICDAGSLVFELALRWL